MTRGGVAAGCGLGIRRDAGPAPAVSSNT